jgi:hypothetical protein
MQRNDSHSVHREEGSIGKYSACLPAFLGSAAAVVALLLAFVAWLYSQRIPLLTDEAFADATARWQARSLANYEIEIQVTGRQAATYHVVVRDGQPVAAERNGHGLPQQRVWRTWSVDGMFDTVRRDLMNEDRQADPASPTSQAGLIVRAEFDPMYGYPSRYLRVQLGQPFDVSWKVTRFVDLDTQVEQRSP